MKIEQAKYIHSLIADGKWVPAANEILCLAGNPSRVSTHKEALNVCRGLFQHLLDNEMYLQAATLQWGPDMFNTDPESTVRVFKTIQSGSLILLMGASSTSKTYAAGGFFLLDYLRDPTATTVKLAAINEDHLKKNLFAHVATLFRACAIPSAYDIQVRDSDLWIGIKEAGYEFGISGIAFKQSQETSGQFKGYKAKPVRKVAHPKFGYLSRLRVLGDEGQNWPGGPFKDFNSLVASKSGSELVKVAVSFNPEAMGQHVVALAEPEDGWREEQLDTLYDYESKAGWSVCRLDAARCENVIQRRVVYPGLQTYEGYISYLKSGGDSSANYYTFARGFPPLKATAEVVIPPAWPQDARGEATFVEVPIVCGAVDLAFMGRDSAQMAVGRWGLASGYRDQSGKFHTFQDRTNIAANRPRHVLQIDQILPLAKHDNTVDMAEEIMGKCRALKIQPEWLAVDKTGYGFGVHGHLVKVWGDSFGVAWNENATERKIVAEDIDGANKQCDGVMSEMWWAFRKWLEPSCRAVLINPIIPPQPVNTQLTTRRYKPASAKGLKVERKEEYMSRNAGHSPDEADAFVMLVHLIRQRGKVLPGLVEQQESSSDAEIKEPIHFTPVKEMVSVEREDSICDDAKED